ncbi:GntR family transcriptional regulator [Acrocarpospora sp. B8E8]|uniref:GntR family transcriptional regulator n=1 Tax=Acrocarpospora sp. B8E8 TaxID=3153572 RepID=UPI00325D90B8
MTEVHGAGTPQLDRDGPVPLYVQIADLVADQIERGELGLGELVPTETELLRAYRICRGTARRVHRELRERGLVYTVPGTGTFVGHWGVPPLPYSMPAYVLIARDLVTQIQNSVYPPNRAIPTHGALSKQHEVCMGTARRAVKMLREAGWAFSCGPRGTFVAPPDQWPDPGLWHKMITVACGADRAEDVPGEEPPDLRRWDEVSAPVGGELVVGGWIC